MLGLTRETYLLSSNWIQKKHSKAHEKALANKNYRRERKKTEKVAEKEKGNLLKKPIKDEFKQILRVAVS